MARHAVLLTDFGLQDPYVGQMKGALLCHDPEARVIDLCHQVEPFNILQAGFFLASSRSHFPEGAVFLCVVDPGVGGDRRILLLEKFRQFFLAPDNGLLTMLLQQPGPGLIRDVTSGWQRSASATFHGRDLFAPLAALLLNGMPPSELGEEVSPDSLTQLPGAEPVSQGEHGVEATVLHVDRFGNCLLNLESEAWASRMFKAGKPALTAPVAAGLHPVLTYERLEQGEVGILQGSQGYLELAMNREPADLALGLASGATVAIRFE